MTTISSRLRSVGEVIDTLLLQSCMPDRIVLNVSSKPYLRDAGISMEEIHTHLKPQLASGILEIHDVPNTGPYRKLLPVLETEFESDIRIVTCDDDTLYPPDWLKALLEASEKQPNAIIAYRCTKMLVHQRMPAPYLDWVKTPDNPEVKEEYRNLFTFPTGKDGVLYKPKFFTSDAFDPEVLRMAPTGDDIAFKFLTMIKKTPVHGISHAIAGAPGVPTFPELSAVPDRLWNINISSNDQMLRDLLIYLVDTNKLNWDDFLIEDATDRYGPGS